MLIAALLTVAPNQKKRRHPSMGKYLNKLWYNQTMEYYSALKGTELSIHEKTWRKLVCILVSETNQFEKAECCNIPTI